MGSSSISLPVFERPLGGPVGLALDRLLASLPVAGGVDHHALAFLKAPEGGPVTEQLHRVDRLAAAPDQQTDVIALDPADDLLGVLLDLHLGVTSRASTTRSRIARTRSAGRSGNPFSPPLTTGRV